MVFFTFPIFQPLQILDLTRLLPGPLATMMLAETGAEVIKIELPDSPDPTRFFPPFVGEVAANFAALNRGKKSIFLDYKTEQGKLELLEMVKRSDVFIEQFRPGLLAKSGLGYHDLAKVNPQLIYVSITGYGQDGPYAQRAGHDLNYLATSGILSLNVDESGRPVIPGVQIADVAAGAYRCMTAVAMAMLERHRTGLGKHVDVAMLDGLMPFMALNYAQHKAGEALPPNRQTFLSGRLANYNVYECADGKYVALGALEPKFWNNFCAWAGRPEWVDLFLPVEEYQAQLRGELSAFFKTRTRDEWAALAGDADICLSAVMEVAEIDQQEQLVARGVFCPPSEGFPLPGIKSV